MRQLNDKKIRLFVSVELDEEVKKELGRFIGKLKRSYFPVRWVPTNNIHITLAFLGWQKTILNIKPCLPAGRNKKLKILEPIEKAAVGMEPFGIKIRGIGCFPDAQRPRVIWLGLAGDLENLSKLQFQVAGELKKAGLEIEERKFIPHLTIGRVIAGTKSGALKNLGVQIQKMQVDEFQNIILVGGMSLMESVLKREGPEYREVESVKLKASN